MPSWDLPKFPPSPWAKLKKYTSDFEAEVQMLKQEVAEMALYKSNEPPYVPWSDKVNAPDIHCPSCGSKLWRDAYAARVRCKCQAISILDSELLNASFATLLKVKLANVVASAVDQAAIKAQAPQGLVPKDFPAKDLGWNTYSGKMVKEQINAAYPSLAFTPKYMGGAQMIDNAPKKQAKDTVKLDHLTPALQEFFKDYVE